MIPHNDGEREPSHANARFTVRYWGVRGSIATPGPETVRYGGNTTCLEIRCDDAIAIIDMGTGARLLGDLLLADGDADALNIDVLFSHLHSDHVIGFPFFAPLYDQRTRLVVNACEAGPVSTPEGLRRVMSYPLFPVDYDTLPAQIAFVGVPSAGAFTVGPATVRTCPLNHPGGAVAFRVEHRGRVFVHASDVEHEGLASAPDLVALCRDADWVSYDAMYVEGVDYEAHRGWGHSTWQAALRLADEAAARHAVITHHAPQHDDAFMDGVARAVAAARPGSIVAFEGLTIDLLADEASPAAPPRPGQRG